MEIVQTTSTVIDVRFTMAGDVSSFGEDEQATLKGTLQETLDCHEPVCFLILRLSSASVAVTVEMVLPTESANHATQVMSVTSAAEALTTQPTGSVSTTLGVNVTSVSTTVARANNVQVPLPRPAAMSRSANGDAARTIAIASIVPMVILAGLLAWYLRLRPGKSVLLERTIERPLDHGEISLRPVGKSGLVDSRLVTQRVASSWEKI